MQKWPISLNDLFFWKLSCTINCVQWGGGEIYISLYIYSYMSEKSTLSSNCNSLIFEENSQTHRCCSYSGLCGFFGFVSV